jgi:hypothetical protein
MQRNRTPSTHSPVQPHTSTPSIHPSIHLSIHSPTNTHTYLSVAARRHFLESLRVDYANVERRNRNTHTAQASVRPRVWRGGDNGSSLSESVAFAYGDANIFEELQHRHAACSSTRPQESTHRNIINRCTITASLDKFSLPMLTTGEVYRTLDCRPRQLGFWRKQFYQRFYAEDPRRTRQAD